MKLHPGPAVLLILMIGLVSSAPAQTIREAVREHVEESLAKEKEKKKDKKKRKEDENKKNKDKEKDGEEIKEKKQEEKKEDEPLVELQSDEEDTAEEPALKLPRRVIHENFKLDLTVGGGYRGWAPQQYSTVAVDPSNFFTWSVGARATFFKVVSLSKARYETNNAASPRQSYVASAAKYGSYALKAAWFLAELGVPALEKFEPTVRYESRSFMAHAHSKEASPVCVVPFNQDADVKGCETTEREMTITSSFETAALGIKIHPDDGSSAVINDEPVRPPSIFIGGGYLSYLKPYQVTIGEHTLEEYLFSGRFYGGGLAFGLDFGGGVNQIDVDVWVQLGLGWIRLTEDMTLNEVAPEDWLIGYIQGNASLSYQWAPFDFAPSLLIVPVGTVSGASFFFFETDVDEGEETVTPLVNWDLLYSVFLSFVITL